MRQLTERTDALATAQARSEVLLQALAQRLDGLTQRMDALTQRMDGLTQRMDALTQQMSHLVDRVGTVEGIVFEEQYRSRYASRFMRLALGLRLIDQNQLGTLLHDSFRNGAISEAELESVLSTDLVLTGRRREDDVDVYLAVEVSVGIGIEDVRRASERARILERFGKPAVAVVAGKWINADAADMAGAIGVCQLLESGTPEAA